ncbi:MAG: LysR family transcriptional regulator [Rhodobacter sp.]|nr:LysR family transcriptional regulator [Paracoccaceae bacterium]MCC0076828.1 LysR family transcriptional regulator [Rhodobacter sp.]
MQPDQIDTFLDLCETRSFNRTAERLGVSQSTVSGRVAALERGLGVALLRRSRAGCELTTEGLRFEPHARALRHSMTEARAAARGAGGRAMSIRLGLQNDLAAGDPARWVRKVQQVLPQAALYIEADFSAQMCRDVLSGVLDLALLFTPHPMPDIHFETLGELRYRMVAPVGSGLDTLGAVTPDRYVLANLAPAFERMHAALLPHLSLPALAAGQGATVQGLILELGIAGYQEERIVRGLVAQGLVAPVEGAPVLTQPIHAAIHYRNRPRALWRKMIAAMRENLGDPE